MCVTLPLPSFSASDFLPPTLEPGTWNPLALRPSAGSATPRPLWTLMGGREKQPAKLGRCILFIDIEGGERQRCSKEKVLACCGPAEKRNAFGP